MNDGGWASDYVVLTGPSRGIGRATAQCLTARGVPCALLGRPSAALSECLAACNASKTLARFVECDVSDPSSIDRAAAELLSWGCPRALINNAGIVERASLRDLSLQSYRRQMDTNLLGAIWLSRALLPAMLAAGRGRIVNVGSISATVGSKLQCVYNASKWALTGFTKSLAEELSDTGLMAVIVHPGGVDTEMMVGSPFRPRMRASDVAQTLAHFALDAPIAHNGAVIEMFGV